MTGFRTIPGSGDPLKVILVGAGPMGRAWLGNLQRSSEVELVGLVDLDLAAAKSAAEEAGLPSLPLAKSLSELLAPTAAEAVVNVTVPRAHLAVTSEALLAGVPVLSEKPIAPTVAEGLSLAATAELTGQLLMVSQSRRYYRTAEQFKSVIAQLGEVGAVTTEFFKAPRFGGFRDEMEHPLLIDMAIHAFDAFRYLFDDDPVSVYCDEYNPPWSWYRGDAAATAVFETRRGARYTFAGSWCSPGLETSWNGTWRVSAAKGSARWNGEDPPTWEAEGGVEASDPGPIAEEIAGSLEQFVRALRTGTEPVGTATQNIPSLAMVEAAIRSADQGRRVVLAEVLDEALEQAVLEEKRPEVAAVLRGWAPAALPLGVR